GSSGSDVQWIYLSATVGDPEELAAKLDASLVEYEERPVPIERHLTFADATEKPDVVEKLVKREYNTKSSKGYRGQTIVFTNSRRRCHELAGRIEVSASPYHAGLSYNERKRTERRFEEGDVAAVVTTAALGAGVDFPASQVVFERLAMGIEWLTVQEF
ncbi:MAG: helicase-related protein, partial [Halobacteria archaeon]|nr:helicase-related protein [Halobacteria archaeon]